MNALDLLFILAVVYGPLAGWLSGPLREASAILGLALGFALACRFHPDAARLLGRWFSDPDYLSLAGFLAIWAAAGFAAGLAGLIADWTIGPRKGWKRRAGASVLGLLRAFCFAGALLVPLVAFLSENAAVLRRSRTVPAAMKIAEPLSAMAPTALRDRFRTKARALRESRPEAGG